MDYKMHICVCTHCVLFSPVSVTEWDSRWGFCENKLFEKGLCFVLFFY